MVALHRAPSLLDAGTAPQLRSIHVHVHGWLSHNLLLPVTLPTAQYYCTCMMWVDNSVLS
jgi:hypothetical protein